MIHETLIGSILLVSAMSVASGPAAKYPVSKETTYLTEPLDGYVRASCH